MAFLTESELHSMGFRSLGRNVRVSERASIYEPELMTIGDNSRVDDFCVLSGEIVLGRNVHLAVYNNLTAGRSSITLGDFSTLAYGCHLVAQSDDYSGETMVNTTIPDKFKRETSEPIVIGRQVVLGTATIVLPGVHIAEGTSAGARTLFTNSTEPWTIYVGTPARKLRDRSKALLELERQFLSEEG
jgi:galactoside O-acetyltransferase